MELILIRHGMTPGNLERRFVGSLDQPLAPQGEALARAVAPTLPPVEHLYVSPLTRCQQTAGLLWEGVARTTVPNLRETDFGPYEGKCHAAAHLVADDNDVRVGRQEALQAGIRMEAHPALQIVKNRLMFGCSGVAGHILRGEAGFFENIGQFPLICSADNENHSKTTAFWPRITARTMAHSQIWRKKPAKSPVMPPNWRRDIRI